MSSSSLSPRRRLAQARAALPQGGGLTCDEFERRHGLIVRLLWVLTFALPAAGSVAGYPVWHTALHGGPSLACVLLARSPLLTQRARSIAATLGLCVCAALGVHIAHGVTEAHFSFFVLVVLLTVYEDWTVFGLAIGFVLVHHATMGLMDPRGVFAEHHGDPWLWTGVHAAFVSAAGLAGIVAWRFNEDVRTGLREAEAEMARAATTDALTGLGNRRALMVALGAAVADGADHVLVIADLDAFKPYNDSFGHPAGDALLSRLAHRLQEAVAGVGVAYRLGGDEFCVLAHDVTAGQVRSVTETALTEHGDGFDVGCSTGAARIPSEVANAEGALRLADARMYGDKDGGRRSAGAQSKDVLLRALRERHPDLGHDLDDMASLSEDVARELGLPSAMVQHVRRAAELHDIGKMAIPDAILFKPGPLDDEEWEFMRRHTIVGERIIGGAPALNVVAAIVRSSHERWDGGGYPDRLTADAIPLGARIVAVCDAFDAMISTRPYSTARDVPAALAELRRCSGSQFDPQVVQAFTRVLTAQRRLAVAA